MGEAAKPLHPALTPKQQRAADLMLAGQSFTEAARALKVDPSTLHRWAKAPAFQAALEKGAVDLNRLALWRLGQLLGRAVDTLDRTLAVRSVGPVQLRAAELVLKAYELHALERRIAALEKGKKPKEDAPHAHLEQAS